MDTQARVCVICRENINDGQEKVTLTQKGYDGIHGASVSRGETLNVAPGQFVHKDCRRTYCNKNVIARDTRKKESTTDTINTPRSLRSHAEKFDFQEHCLFCGHSTKVYGQKRGYDVWPVRTHNVHREILGICEIRGDEWAHTVRGRMEYVAHDLHAADAMYHQTCNVNFRTGKHIPKAFNQQCSNSKQRRGRPTDDLLQKTFLDIVSYLEENDNEQITISDLVNKMHELSGDIYSVTYMKKKLEEHFRESIIITEINGKQNVVTLRNTASSILHDFYKRQKTDDSQTEKLELLKVREKQ